MSVLDRVHKQRLTGTIQSSPETSRPISQAVALAESPFTRRFRATMQQLMQYIRENGDASDKAKLWLIDPLIDCLTEEIEELPPDRIEGFGELFAGLFKWMVSGDTSGLPESMMEFVCKVEGIPYQVPVRSVPWVQAELPASDEEIVEGEIVG